MLQFTCGVSCMSLVLTWALRSAGNMRDGAIRMLQFRLTVILVEVRSQDRQKSPRSIRTCGKAMSVSRTCISDLILGWRVTYYCWLPQFLYISFFLQGNQQVSCKVIHHRCRLWVNMTNTCREWLPKGSFHNPEKVEVIREACQLHWFRQHLLCMTCYSKLFGLGGVQRTGSWHCLKSLLWLLLLFLNFQCISGKMLRTAVHRKSLISKWVFMYTLMLILWEQYQGLWQTTSIFIIGLDLHKRDDGRMYGAHPHLSNVNAL